MVGQIVYKVHDLRSAVAQMKKKGFTVEYGIAEDPYNALVYFTEGPYIELIERTGVPFYIKLLMRMLRCGKLANRLDAWDKAKEGILGTALEIPEAKLDKMLVYLKDVKRLKAFKMPSTRVDTHGRELKCSCLFTEYIEMPFFVTEFAESPKPLNYTHPNGSRCITDIKIQLKPKEYQLFLELIEKFELNQNYSFAVKQGSFDVKYVIDGAEDAAGLIFDGS